MAQCDRYPPDRWRAAGRYVRHARHDAGMTMAALAEATGITERTVRRLETGDGASDRTCTAVERALDLAPGTIERVLLGDSTDNPGLRTTAERQLWAVLGAVEGLGLPERSAHLALHRALREAETTTRTNSFDLIPDRHRSSQETS